MIAQSVVQDLLAMSQSISPTKTTFLAYILPPFACHYLMGVLVQLKGTRSYRLALMPVLVWFAWRATFVDMSRGDPTKTQANSMLAVSVATTLCVARLIDGHHRPKCPPWRPVPRCGRFRKCDISVRVG